MVTHNAGTDVLLHTLIYASIISGLVVLTNDFYLVLSRGLLVLVIINSWYDDFEAHLETTTKCIRCTDHKYTFSSIRGSIL